MKSHGQGSALPARASYCALPAVHDAPKKVFLYERTSSIVPITARSSGGTDSLAAEVSEAGRRQKGETSRIRLGTLSLPTGRVVRDLGPTICKMTKVAIA
jgi:hypothetical protein